jgi:UDP-galactopyranose mutase
VTEWKKIPNHGDNKYYTTLTFELPCDYVDNNFERFYPVKDRDGKNRALYEKYKAEQPENVTFIGRCGLYAYLDMHQAINSALAIARKFKNE